MENSFLQRGVFVCTKSVKTAEAFSDDLAAVCDHHKCGGFVDSQIVSKLYSLAALHDCEDNELLAMGISAFCLENGGTSVQSLVDEIADAVGFVTYNGKILTQVDIFNDTVNHQGFSHETCKREKACGGVKDKAGSNGNE